MLLQACGHSGDSSGDRIAQKEQDPGIDPVGGVSLRSARIVGRDWSTHCGNIEVSPSGEYVILEAPEGACYSEIVISSNGLAAYALEESHSDDGGHDPIAIVRIVVLGNAERPIVEKILSSEEQNSKLHGYVNHILAISGDGMRLLLLVNAKQVGYDSNVALYRPALYVLRVSDGVVEQFKFM